MNATACPGREKLAAYLWGKLPEDEANAITEHLAACAACNAVLEIMDGLNDELVVALRQTGPPNPYLVEPECRRALDELRQAIPMQSAAGSAEPSIPLATQPSMPELLGEYQLLEKIGAGGMGAVYKARHSKLDRIVALKLLPKNRLGEPGAVARFEREMKAVGQLDHPNIVRAHDAREIDGQPVLVMEYIDGWNLSQVVRCCGPLPMADACELARQAAVGLQHAHEHGLVHRDVKPSNLMLTASLARSGRAASASLPSPAAGGRGAGGEGVLPQVKLLDLGLALFQERADEGVTTSRQMMGTWDYMAPEQAGHSHLVDIRADLYSLGCTLYALLSGHAPFSGPEYESLPRKLLAHMHGQVYQWCADYHGKDYYAQSPSVDPMGPTIGPDRVLRGGGVTGTALMCRAAMRHYSFQPGRANTWGMRVCFLLESDGAGGPRGDAADSSRLGEMVEPGDPTAGNPPGR